MQYYDLGTSGLKVSALSLGCWAFGGDKPSGAALGAGHQKVHAECWGKQENEDTNGAVLAALDSGINLFDNAEVYGDGAAETALGHALQACKDKHPRGSYHIATKVTEAFLAPELIEARLDASLERLQTDYVDLYQIHWPSRAAVRTDRYPDRPLAQEVPLEATLAKLDELRKSGKIRHIGVSNFGVQDLTRALATGVPIASNQIIYNLLWRGIEDELLPLCKARGVGVLCWSPMAQGLLTGKYASLDEVAEGRARTRLFSNKRKYQRHGEAGHEESAVRTINAVKEYAEATLRATAAETALAWVMSQPGVSTAIMGARNKDQVLRNVKAMQQVPMAAEHIAALNACSQEIKAEIGSDNIDPYEPAVSSRIK